MDPEPDEEATALVGDLVQAARVPAKRRQFAVKPTVERLTALTYEHGLRPDAFRTLVVDVLAAPGIYLDQASLGSLIRNLYPVGSSSGSSPSSSGTVPEDVVLAIVGCLGQGQLKPTLAIQSLLLRWIVLVYHVLSPQALAVLSRSYAVLFNLLDTAGIRPQLCHVLVLITRRRHTGHDAYLVGLLRVFKNYYPEVIVGEATRGRASPFKHPDPQWRTHLDEIRQAQQQSRLESAGNGSTGVFDSAAYNGFRVKQSIGRRGKDSIVPTVHTIHAQEESVTLEEIDSATSLVKNLETLELPNQLVAVLVDPLLQKLLLLRPSEEAFVRVENWLIACVLSAANDDTDREELMDLIEVIHDYITSTKVGEAYDAVYAQLEARLLNNMAESQLDLLTFYTRVLKHWAVSLSTKEKDQGAEESAWILALVQHVNNLVLALLQSSPEVSSSASSGGTSILAALAVAEFYEQVASVLSLRHDNLLACVQDLIPPPAAVYILHFNQSSAVESRLYAILANYKRAMEAAMARRPSRSSTGSTTIVNLGTPLGNPLKDDERARINQFNGYLMDICNCLWRSRAFSFKDTNALGCRLDSAVVNQLSDYTQGLMDRELPLTSAFNLTHSPTLCLQAISYLRQLEDEAIEAASTSSEGRTNGQAIQRRHAGPVTQAALLQLANSGGLKIAWQAYRSGLLVYLEKHGLGGIAALMYNTMKNLMNSRSA
ncbi:mis6 domain-containing protein [Ophiostoma piceae UAMH 11346]|uniref:Mis6 domain-containing protein n=1 Tax=Ophiostoma piceae (strain UAMH 11346) TaxID=1262450 RepID=S3D7L1_OPHP1|nr:mis6 domain-containing protein [Ophiostoma piceae UAMH 11346]